MGKIEKNRELKKNVFSKKERIEKNQNKIKINI